MCSFSINFATKCGNTVWQLDTGLDSCTSPFNFEEFSFFTSALSELLGSEFRLVVAHLHAHEP